MPLSADNINLSLRPDFDYSYRGIMVYLFIFHFFNSQSLVPPSEIFGAPQGAGKYCPIAQDFTHQNMGDAQGPKQNIQRSTAGPPFP